MSNLVFQYHISDKVPEYVDYSSKSFMIYARMNNLSYLFSTKPYMDYTLPYHQYFEILRLFYDPFFDVYDNILYVDTDVYASLDAPNIFESVDFDMVAGCNERKIPGSNTMPGWHDNKKMVGEIQNKFKSYGSFLMPSKQEGTNFRMINTGVLLLSKKARLLGRECFEDYADWANGSESKFLLLDEPYLNAMFNKYRFDVREFNEEWNMPPHWFKYNPPKSHFYHFSGPSKDKMIEFCENNR